MSGCPPISIWAKAIRQWSWMLLLLAARSALLRLPIPILAWLVERYTFTWMDSLSCDVDRCLFTYWGRYTVSGSVPLMSGYYLVEAVHRETCRSHFALRIVSEIPAIGVLHIMLGHAIKPSFSVIPMKARTGATFTIEVAGKIAKKLYKKFANR